MEAEAGKLKSNWEIQGILEFVVLILYS